MIPPRLAQVEDKECRFYVHAPSSVRIRLIEEATARDCDWYRLAGAVLGMWVAAGCPSTIPSVEEKA